MTSGACDRRLSTRLPRIAVVALIGLAVWLAPAAKSGPGVEYLMVPSPAMGRDIPVAFLAGGAHAVYLLDAFDAGETVSNWVTAGNDMNALAGKGISVVAPASGAYSLYTNWEQDGSRQWESFLADELPNWLAANKGLAPAGHAIVGARRAAPGRSPWRHSIRTDFATPGRCRASSLRGTPLSTARSRPA